MRSKTSEGSESLFGKGEPLFREDNSLTPSQRNELRDAHKEVKSRNRAENEQLMALFQMIYLRIDRSIETFASLLNRKSNHAKKHAFNLLKGDRSAEKQQLERRTTMIVAKLQMALSTILCTAKRIERRNKTEAYQNIIRCAAFSDPLLPVTSKHSGPRNSKHADPTMESPYLRDQNLKSKHAMASAASFNANPGKLSDRRRQDMLTENRELSRNVQKKKQRVRSFLHEMDQILAEHEDFLKQ